MSELCTNSCMAMAFLDSTLRVCNNRCDILHKQSYLVNLVCEWLLILYTAWNREYSRGRNPEIRATVSESQKTARVIFFFCLAH